MTTQKRAKVGGEVGANGEFYEGGKFICTTPENAKRHGSKTVKARKVQVEPYKWVESTEIPLFSMIGTRAQYVDRKDPSKGIEPFVPGIAYCGNEFHGRTVAEQCERFNAGERWV